MSHLSFLGGCGLCSDQDTVSGKQAALRRDLSTSRASCDKPICGPAGQIASRMPRLAMKTCPALPGRHPSACLLAAVPAISLGRAPAFAATLGCGGTAFKGGRSWEASLLPQPCRLHGAQGRGIDIAGAPCRHGWRQPAWASPESLCRRAVSRMHLGGGFCPDVTAHVTLTEREDRSVFRAATRPPPVPEPHRRWRRCCRSGQSRCSFSAGRRRCSWSGPQPCGHR